MKDEEDEEEGFIITKIVNGKAQTPMPLQMQAPQIQPPQKSSIYNVESKPFYPANYNNEIHALKKKITEKHTWIEYECRVNESSDVMKCVGYL